MTTMKSGARADQVGSRLQRLFRSQVQSDRIKSLTRNIPRILNRTNVKVAQRRKATVS